MMMIFPNDYHRILWEHSVSSVFSSGQKISVTMFFFFFNKNPRHSLRVFYSICSLQATQCGEVVKEVTQLSCSNHPVCSISRKVHSLLNRCFVQCQAYISEFFLSKNLYYYWPQCGSSILVLVCYYMIQ